MSGTTDITRAERHVGRWTVDDNLDRYALYDLHVVAGGVLRRQQRERRPGSGLNAGDMSAESPFRIGVDLERHRLAQPHRVELCLLEIRRDPDLVRDKLGQSRAGLRELADRGSQIEHAARLVS